MSKVTMAESLKDRIELVYKDYRYNKAVNFISIILIIVKIILD